MWTSEAQAAESGLFLADGSGIEVVVLLFIKVQGVFSVSDMN